MSEHPTPVVINNSEVARAAESRMADILETIKKYGGTDAAKLLTLLPAGFQDIYVAASLKAYEERTRSAPISVLTDVIGRVGSRPESRKYGEYFGAMLEGLKDARGEAAERESRWNAAIRVGNQEDAFTTETKPLDLFVLGRSDGDCLPPEVAQLLLNELQVLGPGVSVPDPLTLLQVIRGRKVNPSNSPQIERITHETRINNLRPKIPGLEGTSLQAHLQFLENGKFYHMFATVGGPNQNVLHFFRPPLAAPAK